MNPPDPDDDETLPAPERITRKIAALGDWRGATLARMRALILAVDAGIVEEMKWRGTPVWSHGGILCTGETYREVVKLTFARGAALKDPARLFNASLEGNARRAIDLRADASIDAKAFQALVREAIALNAGKAAAKKVAAKKVAAKTVAAKQPAAKTTATKKAAARKAARP